MNLKAALEHKSKEIGFDLFGVADLARLEAVEFPPDRGLKRPSEIMPDVRSVLIMGFVIWDEAMNAAVNARAGEHGFFNFYREITEMLAWRLADWLRENTGARTVPTHEVQEKVAAYLAGLGCISRSTLVVTPAYGSRVRWVALLTMTELEPDLPYTRDLCAEQPLCQGTPLCFKACPSGAIGPGRDNDMPPRGEVIMDRCIIEHATDRNPDPKCDRYLARLSELGYLECTRCSLACPYSQSIEGTIIRERRGLC